MVDYVLDIAKEKGIEEMYAIVLPDNARAMDLMKKKMGFSFEYLGDGTARGTLNLKNEDADNICLAELKTEPKIEQIQTQQVNDQTTKKKIKAVTPQLSETQKVAA